jgi:hypothetical protein
LFWNLFWNNEIVNLLTGFRLFKGKKTDVEWELYWVTYKFRLVINQSWWKDNNLFLFQPFALVEKCLTQSPLVSGIKLVSGFICSESSEDQHFDHYNSVGENERNWKEEEKIIFEKLNEKSIVQKMLFKEGNT